MHFNRVNLTKKQMWHKQMKGQGGLSSSSNCSLDQLTDDTPVEQPKELSEDTAGEQCKELINEDAVAEQPKDIQKTIKQKKKCKGVSFHPTAFVVLIPTADEYHNAGLGSSLWWAEDDFRTFKQTAMEEIREFVRMYPNASSGEVLKKYYDTLLAENDEDDCVCSISPNSVAELSQLLQMPKSSTEEVPIPPSMEANYLFRSSTDVNRPIERSDSVQLYRRKLEDEDMPALEIDSDLVGSVEDNSPVLSPHTPVPKEIETEMESSETEIETSASPPSQGFVGLVPILANAAAMLILSLVQNE